MTDLSPIGWALQPLKRYAEFRGRSSRAELWWFFLFMIIAYMAMYILMFGALGSMSASEAGPSTGLLGAFGAVGVFMLLFWLALLIPSIAVQVRRLHDTNRSGWWLGGFYLLYALYFVMLIGSLGSAMGAAMAGAAEPPDAGGAMLGGTMILGLVMFVYMIALFVFYVLPGTKGANRYGADPYGQDVEQVFA